MDSENCFRKKLLIVIVQIKVICKQTTHLC